MAELKEVSKQLKQQLKAKKRGIDALEDMLKEANRKKASQRRDRAKPEEQVPVVEEQPSKQLLQFFVSGPDGLCVEFQSKSSSSVRDLKREVREAFRTNSNHDDSRGWDGEGAIRLMRHGRVMVDDSTLHENGLHSGDTLIAVIEKVPSFRLTKNSDDNTKMMLDFIGKQQDSIGNMTSEMRQGWEKVVEALTKKGGDQSVDVMKDLLLRMEDRWSRMESAFREGVQAQSQGTLPRRKYRAGELESDHDENYEEINTKMKISSSKIINLQLENESVQASFKLMQEQHEKDMYEIRELLKSLHPQPAPISVVSEEPNASRKISRRTDLKGSLESSPARSTVEGVSSDVLEEKTSDDMQTVTAVCTPGRVVEKSARQKPLEQAPSSPLIITSFHSKHNKCLSARLIDKIDVEVAREIAIDDLIFELRKSVAEQTGEFLARVTLKLKGQEIALGIDVPSGELTSATAAELAACGDLIISISDEMPITDAQLDALVVQMEHSENLSRSGRIPLSAGSRPGAGTDPSRSLDIYRQSLRYSSGGESQPEDDDEEIREEELWWKANYISSTHGYTTRPYRKYVNGGLNKSLSTTEAAVARLSLDDVLRSLNDKEGMTDEELQQETKLLQSNEDKMSAATTKRLKNIQRGIVGAVSAAADSGSEDINDTDFGRRPVKVRDGDSSMRLSRTWMSVTGSSLHISQEKRRAYDSDDNRDTQNYEDGPLLQSVDPLNFKYFDDDSGKDSVSRRHARLGGHSSDGHFCATGSSIGTLDTSNIPTGNFDLNRTIDTNVSMPFEMTPQERALQYEAKASEEVSAFYGEELNEINTPATPSPSRNANGAPRSTGNHSTGSGSPFLHMGDETNDGGSLALSESHDTFADLDGSSRSIDFRK